MKNPFFNIITQSEITLYELAVLFIIIEISRSDAAYHHCIDGAVLTIPMRGNNDAKEILQTNIRYQNRYLASQKCSWQVLMKNMSVPQYIFLSATMRKMQDGFVNEETGASKCNSTMSLNVTLMTPGSPVEIFSSEFGGDQNMSDVFMILPIYNASHILLATFTTGSVQPSANCKRIEMQLSSVVKGHCDRHILLHKTRCHWVSGTELRVEQSNQTGLALAGFSDMGEIRDLVKDNDLRLRTHPYARPLKLGSPVRVGVFWCPGSEEAVYWRSENGRCNLEAANFTRLPAANRSDSSAIQCMSLKKFADGNFSVEFSDCRWPMRSLLSFSESPRQGGDSCYQLPLCKGQTASKDQIPVKDSFSYLTTTKSRIDNNENVESASNLPAVIGLIFLAISIVGIAPLFLCMPLSTVERDGNESEAEPMV